MNERLFFAKILPDFSKDGQISCQKRFFQHTVNIGPHRGLAHIQLYGNLGIGFSLAEQAQSLYLTVRQVAGELVATIL